MLVRSFEKMTMEEQVHAGTTLVEASRTKTRRIRNPASGGKGRDPKRLREELLGFGLDRVETEGPGDAVVAAR